jgi:hypothetical protein
MMSEVGKARFIKVSQSWSLAGACMTIAKLLPTAPNCRAKLINMRSKIFVLRAKSIMRRDVVQQVIHPMFVRVRLECVESLADLDCCFILGNRMLDKLCA